MTVLGIVTNIAAKNTADAATFYQDLLGLKMLMDQGWIVTYSSGETMSTQLSVATEGGSGTLVPDIPIEVDNVNEIHLCANSAGLVIVYEITDEPWGVRTFYVHDPLGKVINILEHIETWMSENGRMLQMSYGTKS